MNLSQFFITRPIFAGVLSAIILIAGLIALPLLPISEYPEVVPPTVVVRASYPGANPEVIAETVASPLEQAINGVENMLYQSSQATADGVMTLTITFKLGSDVDKAQVLVQNRVAQAMPKLPQEVQRLGVTTNKASPDLTMVVHLVSPAKRYDMLYLSNFAVLQVKDELARLDGVGDVQIFGAGNYSMRVWLDPDKVASRNLTAGDVVKAIREQNVQVAAGALGAPPMPNAADFQLSINTKGRLVSEADFGDIVVRAGAAGQITRLRDVARIELGADSYALRSLLDNQPAVAIPIFARPGSNAIAISTGVRAKMAELKKNFPADIDYTVVYDPTVFVRSSIEAVVHTLFEAIVLVVIVVIVFLQTWRASVIPLIAVPVSLIGTFAVMQLFGFSLNALSLFGMVLAIGIVVDDSIVVVENVERNIERGLAPLAATRQAMKEVTRPIIATALVLCAVFVPTAFISGLSGQFYKQFALTIAISTVISAINSLTLSPALSALLLKPRGAAPDRLQRLINAFFGWFFRPFNRFFARSSDGYLRGVARFIRLSGIALVLYGGLIGLAWLGFATTPTGFVPAQDKQYLVAFAQLPDAATLDRTEDVITRMGKITLEQPGVAHAVAFPGLSINGFTNSPNSGIVFVTLKPFEERGGASESAAAIAGALNQKFASIQDAYIAIFPPPPVQGLGTIGGFRLQVEDRGSSGFEELYKQTQNLIAKGSATPGLGGAFSSFQVSVPQIRADVDREKVKSQGVDLQDVYDTMQIYLGSLYANDFNRFGRTYQVNVQAEPEFRLQAEDIVKLKTRNAAGEMIPLSSFVAVTPSSGPDRVMHYNGFPTAEINGAAAPGFSTGQAQKLVEDLAHRELPNGMSFAWTELTYQQILAGNTMIYIFPLVGLLVFLVLAAQYESFALPLAVIMILPMVLLSAILGVKVSGGDNNIFTQISLIVLVGLASKNAILIVEFAREAEVEGASTLRAVLKAARLRLRPILMTSFAFIMGVTPLVLSHGAGAEMRHAMGVAVFSGMLGVTFFGLILTPVFYVLVRRIGRRHPRSGRMVAAAVAAASLGACAVGPNFKPPLNQPATLINARSDSSVQLAAVSPDGVWWQQFDDPVLDDLMAGALDSNLDVAMAGDRVRAARAAFSGAEYDYGPHVPLAAGYQQVKEQQPGFTDQRIDATSYSLGFDATWELDLFGHVRRSVEAARGDLAAEQEALQNARVTVAAEVARNYFSLRSTQQQIVVANQNLANQQDTVRLTTLRYDSGRGTELDVQSSRARLKATEATLPQLETAAAAARYRLAVLAGQRPGAFDARLEPRTVPVYAKTLPIGEQGEEVSALLRNRPDVREAERRLAAATARVGIATADLFPRITVSGFVGFLSGDFSHLFSSSSSHDARAWSVAPSVSWPALDLGSVRARLRGSRANADEILLEYEKTVLTALEETENAFVDYREQQTRLKSLLEQAAASRRAAELAEVQYREGVADFLTLLDAQRTQLAAESAVAEAEGFVNTDVVVIYKALGGVGQPAAQPLLSRRVP